MIFSKDSQDRKYQSQLNVYFDEVIAHIHAAESLLIFGAGEAKGELEKRLAHSKPVNCNVTVEADDEMTDRETAAEGCQWGKHPISRCVRRNVTCSMTAISPRQLHERVLQEQKLQLLDVRSPEEHEKVHVPGVQLAPLDDIDDETFPAESGFSRDLPIYIFCSSGNRAKQASEKLGRIGYTQCHFVEGGTEAWVKAGLPVNRGTNAIISVENQVRVAAGGLVVVSFLLTYVNPVFVWLSAFVGVGLLISGFTDWCGMGMIISRMPWNRRTDISDPVEK